MESNGRDYRPPTERDEFIGAVERLNGWIRSSDELRRLSSEQWARDFEAFRAEVRGEFRALFKAVLGIEHDVDEVRRDQTDPRGLKLLDPAQDQPSRDNGSGSALAIRDGKVRLAVPASWAGALLKYLLSAGLGGALIRLAQWFTHGH